LGSKARAREAVFQVEKMVGQMVGFDTKKVSKIIVSLWLFG
jgi:hypothetical protein